MTEQAKVPAIRFAGFTDPWEQRKLEDIAETSAVALARYESNSDYGAGHIVRLWL